MLLIFGLFVVIVIFAIFGNKWAHQRREALSEVAGLEFRPDHIASGRSGSFLERLLSAGGIPGPYEQFPQFRRGSNRKAYNTLAGNAEFAGHRCEVWAGDFRYQTTSGTGKNRRTTTHRFSYALVSLPFESRKTTIRPENFLDRIGEFVGIDDIDFESDAFSRAFHVTGDDKRFAYDLCDPQMMEFLLDTRPPAFTLTGSDASGRNWLLLFGGGTWAAEEFDRRLDWTARFLDAWPRHLRGDKAFDTLQESR